MRWETVMLAGVWLTVVNLRAIVEPRAFHKLDWTLGALLGIAVGIWIARLGKRRTRLRELEPGSKSTNERSKR